MATRKYFLDWLRVGAFAVLILFHTGLLYVSWPFNLKSPHPAIWLEQVLQVETPWRMALIFVISGVASRFLMQKLGPGGFALDRLRRLLPAILVGMFVVIPPQTYVELVAKGVAHESYLRFWVFSYLVADQTLVAPLHKTMPTWDHLWFLVYLLDYALLLAGALALGRALKLRNAKTAPLPVLVVAPALWLAAANVVIATVAPLTQDLVHDWGGHMKWIGLFATGVAAAGQPRFWTWTCDRRVPIALTAAALFGLQAVSHGAMWHAVSGLYAWAAICAICGYAHRYLDRPSLALSHLNEAILPVYVLHQPVMLVAAFWIFRLGLPMPWEALSIVAATGLGSFGIYEVLIRPFALARWLFGVKARAARSAPARAPAAA